MTKNKNVYNLIIGSFAAVAFVLFTKTAVVANENCEPNYGGGETCLINKRFKIEKKVRLEGDNDCRSKVTIDLTDKDEKGKYIEFCIKVKNLSDENATNDFDNMKISDDLPDVFDKIGGAGLTEYWGDFAPGETKEFKIKVELKDKEVDKDGDYEKCVVNRAKLYWDGEFEGSDTATVCYTNKEVTELPKTGGVSGMIATGLGFVTVGLLIKKSKRLVIKK